MALQLVLDGYDRMEVRLADNMLESLRAQLDRAVVSQATDAFGKRLAMCLAASLTQCIDWDLQPPTAKQVRFAMGLGRRLAVTVPDVALQFRGAMGEFLSAHAAVYYAQQAEARAVKELASVQGRRRVASSCKRTVSARGAARSRKHRSPADD